MKKYKGISYFTGVEVVGSSFDQIGDRYFIEDEKTGNWVQVDEVIPVFNIGDRVMSESKYSKDQQGTVYKISNKGVHVRFEDRLFQVFHFKSKHHMQTPIRLLRLVDV